ncbi:DUF4166 domain-containing protein [Halomicrobium katesii]|uniref:DUF4166 domain-containing protein n=1 Tax=Halomicrobium katesii TaxID=437163 RepID=UPI00037153BF|nr:DUF4166 domain-containing protein [Halomicrobium katesii]
MTGVYAAKLADETDHLHERVRDRYALASTDEYVCVGRGEMDITRGTLLLPGLYAMPHWNLLFPERGEAVPFTVTTAGVEVAGREALITQRAFTFESTTRRFDSLTVYDDDRDRLFDFLGRGGHIVSELHPRVESSELVIEGGKQWVRVAGQYLPLAGPMAATVEVRDNFLDSEDRFRVRAEVTNPLVGEILGYSGTFTQKTESRDMDSLRPGATPTTLPA